MNLPGGAVPGADEFRFMLTSNYAHMEGLGHGTEPMAAGSINASDLLASPKMGKMPAGKYPAVPTSMDTEMVGFGVGYSFSARLFGAVMGSWVRDSMGMEMTMAAGGGMTPKRSPVTANNAGRMTVSKTVTSSMGSDGFGDTMLVGKYLVYTNDLQVPTTHLSLYFGLSLPTGSIEQGNYKGPLPYMMQLGSGTVDPAWGLVYQASASPYWWGADAIFTPRLYDNSEGYRLGDQFNYDLYLMYRLGDQLVPELQLNGYWQDRIHGAMEAATSGEVGHVMRGVPSSPYMMPGWDPANYGGHALWITTGFQWQPLARWMMEFQIGTPLYQYLNGPQLQRRFRLTFVLCHRLPTPW